MLKKYFCQAIFMAANRLITRCRSKEEYAKLHNSFQRHFSKIHEDENKAQEYERIMGEKDKLIEAIEVVKTESVETRHELSELEYYINQIEEENETMKSLIALICQLHLNEEWDRLDGIVKTLSNQYLPSSAKI